MYTYTEEQNIAKALAGDAPASVPAFMLCDLYGSDWFEWEPEAVRAELVDLNMDCSERTFEALMGLQTALTSAQWASSVRNFIAVVNAIGGDGTDPNTFDPAEIDEIYWTLTELRINGIDDRASPDVAAYVTASADYEGYLGLPKLILEFVGLKDQMPLAGASSSDYEVQFAVNERERDLASLNEAVQARLRDLYFRLSLLPIKRGDKGELAKYFKDLLK